ncbi:hypothetical protein C9J85_01095 [Haloferax sp. wsp5]|nr:hypothetical protein C9J85_01095 [Haloferax sp. wsp5]
MRCVDRNTDADGRTATGPQSHGERANEGDGRHAGRRRREHDDPRDRLVLEPDCEHAANANTARAGASAPAIPTDRNRGHVAFGQLDAEDEQHHRNRRVADEAASPSRRSVGGRADPPSASATTTA